MATHRGNDGTVKIGSNTLAEVTGFSLSEQAQTMDDSAIGDDWDTHLVGSKNWSGEVTCWWDETDTNGQNLLTVGASVTLNLYPEGADSGDSYFSGTATVTQIQRTVRRNQTIEVTFSFTGNGALSATTV